MTAFEAEYLELLERYKIPVAVLCYQNGTTLSIRASADDNDPVSITRSVKLSHAIEKAIRQVREEM